MRRKEQQPTVIENHYHGLTEEDYQRLTVVLEEIILRNLKNTETLIMASLSDILTEEGVEGGEISQLVTAYQAQTATIADLQAQIAALAPGTLTADQQAQIDQTFAAQQANDAALTAALPVVVTPPPVDTTPPADGTTPPADGTVPPVDGTPAAS